VPEELSSRSPLSRADFRRPGGASESGHWVERWTEETGGVILAGRYATLWRRVDGQWYKVAEVLIALSCQGSYCR